MKARTIPLLYRTAEAIYKRLGPGYRELWYHRILAIELSQLGLTVHYEGLAVPLGPAGAPSTPHSAGRLPSLRPGRFDLLLDAWLIVELKSRYCLTQKDRDQLTGYLETCNLRDGIILNFRHRPPHRVERRRIRLA